MEQGCAACLVCLISLSGKRTLLWGFVSLCSLCLFRFPSFLFRWKKIQNTFHVKYTMVFAIWKKFIMCSNTTLRWNVCEIWGDSLKLEEEGALLYCLFKQKGKSSHMRPLSTGKWVTSQKLNRSFSFLWLTLTAWRDSAKMRQVKTFQTYVIKSTIGNVNPQTASLLYPRHSLAISEQS